METVQSFNVGDVVRVKTPVRTVSGENLNTMSQYDHQSAYRDRVGSITARVDDAIAVTYTAPGLSGFPLFAVEFVGGGSSIFAHWQLEKLDV